jgi:DNA ligase (NAD+)
MSRTDEIVKQLREASQAYYNGEAPVMSDADYDSMRDELERINPRHPFLSEVGASPSDNALKKAKHSMPMGSLNKVNTLEEYTTWLKSTIIPAAGNLPNMAVQCKYDGSSIELVYKNGKFVQAITRGDGLEGEDVTHTIKNASGFPREVKGMGDFFVRCEAILPIETWQQHFKGEANPRNSSNGTVRRTDAEGSKHLVCLAFNILSKDRTWPTRQNKMNWLEVNNFTTAMTRIVTADQVESVVNEFLNKRPTFQYEIDGMVVHLNDETVYAKLGENDNRPYAARAWKFPPMGGHTILEDVTWDVGTRGTITPVAVVKPISVGGVTITNVTLHNMDEISRKDIHIGDEVEVVRAGDVIPYIVRVVKPAANRVKIHRNDCPGCGGKVGQDGPFLRCLDPKNCAGTQAKRIKGWIKKRDIKYLGDSNLGKLIESKTIRRVPDLYFLTVEKMVKGGVTSGMAEKIIEELKKSMDVDFADLVGSLSLDLLGRREAKNIVECGIVSLDQWEAITPADLMKHEGYKDVNSTRIVAGLKESWPLIKELAGMLNVRYGVIKKAAPASGGSGKLNGKSFCFTGKMSKQRSELQALVEANGGINFDEVNKTLSYLVIDDPNSESSKAKKARKVGTTLLSEAQFMQMI